MKKERILVTAALPYANGPIHIGHAIGAYVPADVYTRYHRLRGDDVVYICGSDEHGTPIAVAAEKEGITPREVVDKYRAMHIEAFKRLGVEFDNYSGTARGIHYKVSQDFFLKVNERGFIYRKTVLRPYCPKCKRFLPDRYVKGVCPKCDSADERGDQCEKCGKQLEPHELKKPYCVICHETPEMRETTHWFFKLSELSGRLGEWVEGNTHWPANARNFALGWIREGLEDRAITRDLSWGIPVPLPESEGKVLYVWFDAPIGYISSTKEWAEKKGRPDEWRKYWQGGEARIVHFIGKDNIPFHAIIWPATLMAEGSYNLPWQIASNEYLNLEGRKMSTSRGWVLWLADCLDEFKPDVLRYYLLCITPQTSDSDFSLTGMQERVNNELIATLGNFVNRTLTFIKQKNNGVVPKPDGFDGEDERIMELMKRKPHAVGELIEKLNFTGALGEMMSLSQEGNKYFQAKEPWRKENATTLYLCANLVKTLAVVMEPFLPFSAEEIWNMLGMKGSVRQQEWSRAGELTVEGGHRIGGIKTLYAKIEDGQMEGFKRKYLPEGAGDKAKQEVKGLSEVEYAEFQKMDMRVATVKKVETHPNAEKLLLLTIDVGELGERKIVAGIKESYRPDELVGRQIIVVSNLKAAKIRGVESRGMLLAADEGGKPVLLQPDRKLRDGSRVK